MGVLSARRCALLMLAAMAIVASIAFTAPVDACTRDAPRAAEPALHALPVRRAGLWRLTTVSDATGMRTFVTCIAASDAVVNGIGDKDCETSPVTTLGDERYVTVVCRTDVGKQTTSTVLTGDFSGWYRAMSKVTFAHPKNGLAHLGVTIDGVFLRSDCAQAAH
jgi:hypothetical protein